VRHHRSCAHGARSPSRFCLLFPLSPSLPFLSVRRCDSARPPSPTQIDTHAAVRCGTRSSGGTASGRAVVRCCAARREQGPALKEGGRPCGPAGSKHCSGRRQRQQNGSCGMAAADLWQQHAQQGTGVGIILVKMSMTCGCGSRIKLNPIL
jgi:hypothetical protein